MAKFRSWLWTIVCSREDLQARVSYLTGTEGKKERKIERERERKRETERERERERNRERERKRKKQRERKKERVGESVRIHCLYYHISFL